MLLLVYQVDCSHPQIRTIPNHRVRQSGFSCLIELNTISGCPESSVLPDGTPSASVDAHWFLPHLHIHRAHSPRTAARWQHSSCSKCRSAHALARDFIRADVERLERESTPEERRLTKRAAMLSSQAHKRALRRQVPDLFYKKGRPSPAARHRSRRHMPCRSPLSSVLDLSGDQPAWFLPGEAVPAARCFTPPNTLARRAEVGVLAISGKGSPAPPPGNSGAVPAGRCFTPPDTPAHRAEVDVLAASGDDSAQSAPGISEAAPIGRCFTSRDTLARRAEADRLKNVRNKREHEGKHPEGGSVSNGYLREQLMKEKLYLEEAHSEAEEARREAEGYRQEAEKAKQEAREARRETKEARQEVEEVKLELKEERVRGEVEVGYLNGRLQMEREKAAEDMASLQRQLEEARQAAREYYQKVIKLHAAVGVARERAEEWRAQLVKKRKPREATEAKRATQETAKGDKENIPSQPL